MTSMCQGKLAGGKENSLHISIPMLAFSPHTGTKMDILSGIYSMQNIELGTWVQSDDHY